jgi:hypothetical protein
MIKNLGQMRLWPTHIGFYDLAALGQAENEQLRQAVLQKVDLHADLAQELRVHHLEKVECEAVRLLSRCVCAAVTDYLGLIVQTLSLRGVVIRHGKHICTHTEAHESDLMAAYWPGGNMADRGQPPSIKPSRQDAPTFVVEDPSRHLTDLRLPGELRHSVCIKPRPGMLVLAPAHLPHNLHPYMGQEPFIHIVAQVRLRWPDHYEERW